MPLAADESAGRGLFVGRLHHPPSMASSRRAKLAPIECPECGYRWDRLPIPAPVRGYQPQYQRCPNHKCTRRHWFIVYLVSMMPVTTIQITDVVHLLGRDSNSIRQTLLRVNGIDSDLVEWTIWAMEQPELGIG